MKQIIKIIALYIPYIGTASCEKDFNPEISAAANQIVVNALLNNEVPVSATVTKSFPVGFYEELPVEELTDATVLIYENEVLREEMKYQKTTSDVVGQFVASFPPSPNNTYQIEVEHPSYGMATADDILPNSIAVTDTGAKFRGENVYDFSFTIQDPAEENYYYLRMYFEGYIQDTTTLEKEIVGPILVEIPEGAVPEAQRYLNNGYIFKDDGFNGKAFTIAGVAKAGRFLYSFTGTSKPRGVKVDTRTLYIRLENLSADAYKFYSSHALTLQTEVDFFTESTAVFSNVENGLGIFAGINVATVGIEVD